MTCYAQQEGTCAALVRHPPTSVSAQTLECGRGVLGSSLTAPLSNICSYRSRQPQSEECRRKITNKVLSKFRKVKRRRRNYKVMKCSVGVSAYGVQPIWTLANGDSLAVWVGFVRTDRAAVASKTACDRTSAKPCRYLSRSQEVGHAHFAKHPVSVRLTSLPFLTCNHGGGCGAGTSSHTCAFLSALKRLISWISQKPLPSSQSPGGMSKEHLRWWRAARPA